LNEDVPLPRKKSTKPSGPANKVAYPGSFDPITNGHCDIIKRIQPIFGEVTVLISNSKRKNYLFTAEERKVLAEQALQKIPNVKVEIHKGLTVDYLHKHKIGVMVRGLRAVSDFENELAMANMNKKLAPDIETMIVFSSPEHCYISSHMVKEVAEYEGRIRDLVPANVEKALKKKYKK
jgi:pantetheine-phosphate adenylyltransferase